MSRYPRAARMAKLKCITCNAPVVETVLSQYVCVNCGREPVRLRSAARAGVERSAAGLEPPAPR